MHWWRVLLYVRVELILCERHPFLRSRLNKRDAGKWTDRSVFTTFQVGFLKKVISNIKLFKQAWGETNLWCNIELKWTLSKGNCRSKIWGTTLIRPKRIHFPKHFCYCFFSNLCVLNTTNTD
jgi:hypothetical protein